MKTVNSKYPHPAIIAVMVPVGIVCGLIGVYAAGLVVLRLLTLAYLLISSL